MIFKFFFCIFREQVLSLQRQAAELSNQCDVTRDQNAEQLSALRKEHDEALSKQKSEIEAANREATVALQAELDSKYQQEIDEIETKLKQEIKQQQALVSDLKSDIKV